MEESFSLRNQEPIQYENTLQRIAKSLESIAKSLERIPPTTMITEHIMIGDKEVATQVKPCLVLQEQHDNTSDSPE